MSINFSAKLYIIFNLAWRWLEKYSLQKVVNNSYYLAMDLSRRKHILMECKINQGCKKFLFKPNGLVYYDLLQCKKMRIQIPICRALRKFNH